MVSTTAKFGRGGGVLVIVEWSGRLGKKVDRGMKTITMEEEKLATQSWQLRQQSNRGN